MKKIAALSGLVVAALLFMGGAAFAAGTVVLTKNDVVPGQGVTIYTYTMTGDSVDGTFPATSTGISMDGWIISAETNPGTAPTDAYDITLVDVDGADVMMGALADRSPTLSQKVIYPQPYVRGAVTITGTNNSEPSAVVVLKITVLR